MEPFFSVVIPTYNRAHLIKKTIESVRQQTFSNWELIVVDDGSTDNTKEVVLSIDDERVHYVYQNNAERGVARNNGFHHSKGRYICFLDSDDYYENDHLESLHKAILSKESQVVFFVTNLIVTDGEKVKKVTYDLEAYEHPFYYFWYNTVLVPVATCIHREIVSENLFLEKYKKGIWEDTHLWLRILAQHPVEYIPIDSAVQYNHDMRSISTTHVKYERVFQAMQAINDLYENYQLLISEFLTKHDFTLYKEKKLRWYIYEARRNGQVRVAVKLWKLAMKNKVSWSLLLEFPKILLSFKSKT